MTQAYGHDSRAVANRFVELAEAEGKPITVVSLVEYVYLAHAWHLGLFHQPLIFHDVEVLEHGPLIAEMFDAFCPDFPKSVRDPVEAVPGCTATFTRDEEMVITKTYNHYSKMSPESTLELITRSGTPWDKAQYS